MTELRQRNEFDIIVVGAGPAGLNAALTLAHSAGGRSIALVDKQKPGKGPAACAEAVHRERLTSVLTLIKPEWVRREIDGVIFHSPAGHSVKFSKENSGLIINRPRMQQDLAHACAEKGVHCFFNTRITDISDFDGRSRKLSASGIHAGEFYARIVIDASGPGKRFLQDENIVHGDFDVEPAVFALVSGLEFPSRYIQLFYGSRYAPGGYGWLFPSEGALANIGLVISREHRLAFSPRKTLLKFLSEQFPGGQINEIRGGAIPCGFADRPLACRHFFKTGDAANMVNPISRAGIVEAMQSGRLAADSALLILGLSNEKEKASVYKSYLRNWKNLHGNSHLRLAKAKHAFGSISDKVFDSAARKLSKVPENKMTMGKIFSATLLRNPLLLWKMRSLIMR